MMEANVFDLRSSERGSHRVLNHRLVYRPTVLSQYVRAVTL
jgi:hypothetical protein